MKNFFCVLIFLINYSLPVFPQFTHTGRGMYVDKFFRTAINPSGVTVANPVFSILGVPAKENALLQYAKDNHITYLILYDLHYVFGNSTFEGYLCSFMQKAKTQYCIEKIGVASSCISLFDNVAVIAATPAIDLADARFNGYTPDEKNQLSLVEQTLDPNDTLFYRSEVDKLAMMMVAFNDNCAYKFDLLVTEYEFWNAGIDDCTGQNLNKDQKYINYQGLINDADVIRDNYNSTHTHQIYIESYLGYIDQNTNSTHQQIANWIDGLAANGKRRVDRVNLHYYGLNPLTLYSRTSAGQNYTGYYLNRFLDFCQSSTNNQTNFCPIFSSEYTTWGAGASFLGPWLNQNVNNNLFTAERAFYNDWYADATTFSPTVVGSVTLGNKVNPGSVVWFTSGQMDGHINNPQLFTSNSPVCVASGQNGTFQFQYQGPIEQGSSFKFYITNANTTTLRCGTLSSIAWPVYNAATQTSINLNAAIGTCSLPVGDYDAHLELSYAACATYSQVMRISVTNTGKIVALTPTSNCQGNPIFLQASSTGSGTTTYAWYDGGSAISGATSSTYAPGAASAGTHNYSCKITSSVAGCSANLSNVIPVTINAYPVAAISGTTSSGCTAVLQASPANATYLWHDGSTSRSYSTTLAGNYSVAVTVNGCTSKATYNYAGVNLTLASQTNTCNGGSSGSVTVNIASGTSPYSLSWSGPVNGSVSGLAAGNRTISNLSAGAYTITVTDASGCTKTLSATVASNAAINATTSSTSATCPTSSNGSASVTAVSGGNGGPYTYLWLYNNSTGSVLSNIPPGTYVVEIKDGVPCTITKNVTVSSANSVVIPSVSITSSAGTTICSGASTTFTAVPVNGGSTPVFQWKKNGVNVGTNSSTFTISTLANNDVITCVLTSNALCASPVTATSNSITMTVNTNLVPSVTITANPGTTICSGVSVTFTAVPVNGGSTPSYQWKKNGVVVGTNSSTFTSSALVNSDVITCVITASAGCFSPVTATSNSLTMTVNPLLTPSVSISSNSGTTSCSGTNIIFTAVPINGGAAPSYQWKKNGLNTGTNSATYSTTTLVNGDIISCVMTSNATCLSVSTATSNSITMTINPNVTPSLTITATGGNTICAGASKSFTASPVNGGTSPSYQWKVNGANTGTNSSTFTSLTLSDNDVVSCTMTSNVACASPVTATSNSITMTVNANVTPSVSITSNSGTSICSGVNVTFTAVPVYGGSNPVYEWKKNGIVVGTGISTFSTAGIVNGDVITCKLTSNEACVTSTTANSNSITMQVTSNVTPSVSITSSQGNTICPGTSVTFTATPVNGGSAPSYQWKKNGLNVGTNSPSFSTSVIANNDVFTCSLSSSISCVSSSLVASNSITMTVNSSVTAAIVISSNSGTSICSGSTVVFTATPTGGGTTPGYQWKKNGVNVGTNSTGYSDNQLVNNDVISCVLTSNDPCAANPVVTSNLITMQVNANVSASVTVSAAPGSSVCAGTNVQFTATPVNGGAQPVYQWKRNNVNVGTNSPTYSNNSLVNSDVIKCTMTSNANCVIQNSVTSNSITMAVTPVVTPSVSITALPGNSVCSGASVQFTATVSNGGTTPVIQWKVNGVNAGSNSTTFTSSSFVNSDVVSCTITSNASCASPVSANSNSITMNVSNIVVPSVTISSNAGSVICGGASVIFNAVPVNGGNSPVYQWKKNGVNVGSTGSSYSTSSLQNNDIITCVLTSNSTCASPATATSNNITMTVYPVLTPSVTITAIGGNNVCSNAVVQFNATAVNGGNSPSYQWRKNGVSAGTNSSSFTASALVNGDVISCLLTSNATCASPVSATSNSITMNVTPVVIPSVSISSNAGANVCPGTSVLFTAAQSNGGSAPVYQWKKNNINVGTNNITYSDNTLTNSDVITCQLTSNHSCAVPVSATSNGLSVILNSTIVPAVSIVSSHGNNICLWDTVTFNATPANGGSNPAYQWKKNGLNVGGNSNTYSSATLLTGDTITCEMTSNANCVVVNPAISNKIGITANTCGITLDLRVLIQGFYKGGAEMFAVSDPSGQSGICDTISVALINPLFPFNQLYVTKGVIDIFGFGMFVFPNAILNTDYYLVVRHRNSLEAWSSLPVYAAVSITYDFTVSDTTAYGGNLADLGDGNFALWSGDISGSQQGGQDGIIDDIDLSQIENAALNFSTGYKASDISGDNMTELVDYSIIENNRNMLIIVSRP